MGLNWVKRNKVRAKWVIKWLKSAKKANGFGQKDQRWVKGLIKGGQSWL